MILTVSIGKIYTKHVWELLITLSDRLYTSESDVCRRQILKYKDDPRTERKKIKIFLMAVDP